MLSLVTVEVLSRVGTIRGHGSRRRRAGKRGAFSWFFDIPNFSCHGTFNSRKAVRQLERAAARLEGPGDIAERSARREGQPHRERAAAPGSPSELVVTQLLNNRHRPICGDQADTVQGVERRTGASQAPPCRPPSPRRTRAAIASIEQLRYRDRLCCFRSLPAV
jgi:hypothetical protein